MTGNIKKARLPSRAALDDRLVAFANSSSPKVAALGNLQLALNAAVDKWVDESAIGKLKNREIVETIAICMVNATRLAFASCIEASRTAEAMAFFQDDIARVIGAPVTEEHRTQ